MTTKRGSKVEMQKTSACDLARFRKMTCSACGAEYQIDYGVEDKELLKIAYTFPQLLCEPCCDIEAARQEKEQKRQAAEYYKIHLDGLVKASRIPESRVYGLYDKGQGNSELKTFNYKNRSFSLFIADVNDTGKTWTMCATASWMIQSGECSKVQYWNFNELCTRFAVLQSDNVRQAEAFKIMLVSQDLLIIDDFGKKKINGTACDLIYYILDKIYLKNGRIWISANLSGDALQDKFEDQDIGAAVISRLRRMEKAGNLIPWKRAKNKLV